VSPLSGRKSGRAQKECSFSSGSRPFKHTILHAFMYYVSIVRFHPSGNAYILFERPPLIATYDATHVKMSNFCSGSVEVLASLLHKCRKVSVYCSLVSVHIVLKYNQITVCSRKVKVKEMKIGIDNVEQPMAATVLSQDAVSKEDFEAGDDFDSGSSGSVGSEYSSWDDDVEQPIAATVLSQDAMSKEDFEAGDDFDAGSSGSVGSEGSWDDDSLLEIEERIQEFSHVGATPALADMVFNTAEFKLALPRSRASYDDGSVASEKNSVSSEIVLSNRQKQSLATFALRRSNSAQNSYTASAPTADADATFETDNTNQGTKPEDCLKNILEQQGITVPNYSEEFLADLMLEMGAENFAAYDRNISDAARTGDLDAVREHVNSGKTLQCCNKFQESAMHLVCRRGNTELLRYMLEEADVSPCIRDDIGRTPLHELAWMNIPNFEMAKLIIVPFPELLYIKDSRGYTPLSYVGRKNWEKWCEFLEANRDILAPRKL
jgi:hypothetical protein